MCAAFAMVPARFTHAVASNYLKKDVPVSQVAQLHIQHKARIAMEIAFTERRQKYSLMELKYRCVHFTTMQKSRRCQRQWNALYKATVTT